MQAPGRCLRSFYVLAGRVTEALFMTSNLVTAIGFSLVSNSREMMVLF